MDVNNFIMKYSKIIIGVLLVLFCFKSFQSCIRDTKINKIEKQKTHLNDSLNKVIIDITKKYEIENQKAIMYETAYKECNTNLYRATGKNITITNNIKNLQPSNEKISK